MIFQYKQCQNIHMLSQCQNVQPHQESNIIEMPVHKSTNLQNYYNKRMEHTFIDYLEQGKQVCLVHFSVH